MTDQPEALRVAHWLERDGRVNCYEHPLVDAARLLREQHAEIEQLREQLSLDWKMISEQRGEIEQLRERWPARHPLPPAELMVASPTRAKTKPGRGRAARSKRVKP